MTVITDRKAFEKAATPILATDAKRLPKLLEKLTAAQRRWVEASDFEGRAHTHCAVPGAKGEIDLVLAGVRDADDPWALAHLPLKLAAGPLCAGQGAGDDRRGQGRVRLGARQLPVHALQEGAAQARRPAARRLGARSREALGLADAVKLVRDLVNTPAEDMGPAELSDIVREQADLFGARVRRVGGRRAARAELPGDPRRGPRRRARAAPARAQLGQPEAPAPRHRRQGRVLRHRRPRHQGRRGHAPHEEGHGRRRARHRARAPGDAAEAPRTGCSCSCRPSRTRSAATPIGPGDVVRTRQGPHRRDRQHRRRRAASSCATRSPTRWRTSRSS